MNRRADPIRLDFFRRNYDDFANLVGRNNMNKYVRLIVTTLCFGAFALLTSTSSAQNRAAKVEAIAQQLNLTPEQKAKILPILRQEAPKVEAIKNDNSLSKMQKVQQIRTIHQQTDPQMKAILSPEQYQKLQGIRRQAIKDATQTYH